MIKGSMLNLFQPPSDYAATSIIPVSVTAERGFLGDCRVFVRWSHLKGGSGTELFSVFSAPSSQEVWGFPSCPQPTAPQQDHAIRALQNRGLAHHPVPAAGTGLQSSSTSTGCISLTSYSPRSQKSALFPMA